MRKSIEVFEGHELKHTPPPTPNLSTRFRLLGMDGLAVPFDDELLSRHMLFLGSIGSGKTNAVYQILSQLRQNMVSNDVMVVFDSKGDFYEEFYREGDIVFSSDEKATGPNGVNYWNIFKEVSLDKSLMSENINEIARTLFYEKMEKTNQPFFPNAAKDLFTAILLHYTRSRNAHQANNAHLWDFLKESGISELRQILQEHDDLKAMDSYIAEERSPQSRGVFSELQQMVRNIFVGSFCQEGDLSIREAIREKGGKVIFIEYDLSFGNVLTPIYRLLFDLAIKEALGRKKSEGNVWFIIDEFRLLPNLQHVSDGVNFGRSLGAKFIVGLQNVEEVYHAYGESLARSILSGFMTTVAFRVNDAATRTFIQGLFGKNRKIEKFSSSAAGKALTETVREANVVEDWDIANLPLGCAIIGLPNHEPFLFQFKKYGV